MTVSIILPTYNERENIVPLIKAIDRCVRFDHEIIVVDDNSPDGTSRVVRAYIGQSENRSVRIVTRTRDRGLTRSIRHGIQVARGNIIVWMDCDFSMPPSVIPKLLDKIGEGYDIAVGSRYISGGSAKEGNVRDSWIGILLSGVMNVGLRLLMGRKFHDYTSGFVAVKRNVFHSIHLSGDYGEYFIDFIVHAYRKGYAICEIPYASKPRRAGESKTGKNIGEYIWRGRKYAWTIFKLLIEPYVS
jgi:dolichol-phosphate mannosyltransferase